MAAPGPRTTRVIDWSLLEDLCSIFCTKEEIMNILHVTEETLDNGLKKEFKQNFTEYFKACSSPGKMSLRRAQYKKAVYDENVTMLIWMGKQYLGQADKVDTPDPSSKETLQTLIEAMQAAASGSNVQS